MTHYLSLLISIIPYSIYFVRGRVFLKHIIPRLEKKAAEVETIRLVLDYKDTMNPLIK